MATVADFTSYTPTWCPGCGNWGIGRAITNALVTCEYDPSQAVMLFDIGCGGNMADFVNSYAMHTLHGRSIANAVGCKLANHSLPVIVVGGDGALYGEGGNHLLHACRGNHDITVILHDNGVYGLTTGQVAPTARKGFVSKSTPEGIIESPINGLMLSLSQGATFVAQAFAGNMPQLSTILAAGMKHKGFSLINILQPCVSFNKSNSYAYYFKNSYELKDHDSSNFQKALEKAQEPLQEKFPIGVLYQVERPAYHEQVVQLTEGPLVSQHTVCDPMTLIQSFK